MLEFYFFFLLFSSFFFDHGYHAYRRYGTKLPPSVLSDRLAAYVHYFTLHGALRPFGATALVASYDDETKGFNQDGRDDLFLCNRSVPRTDPVEGGRHNLLLRSD